MRPAPETGRIQPERGGAVQPAPGARLRREAHRRDRHRLVALAVAALGLAAQSAVAATAGDPWEKANRVGYAVEDRLDHYLIHPLAQFYRMLTPGLIGRSIHNVLVNLSEPVVFVNDVLQARPKRAVAALARFAANTTFGLLGVIDVAARSGVYHHDNGFGITLGRYRLPPGPYLYLPLLGPSTVRDLAGSGVDFLTNPTHWMPYAHSAPLDLARLVLGGLDLKVSTEDQLAALLGGAADPYATLRSVYLQQRAGAIEEGGVPDVLPDFDTPAPEATPPAETPPQAEPTARTPPEDEALFPVLPAAPLAETEPGFLALPAG